MVLCGLVLLGPLHFILDFLDLFLDPHCETMKEAVLICPENPPTIYFLDQQQHGGHSLFSFLFFSFLLLSGVRFAAPPVS